MIPKEVKAPAPGRIHHPRLLRIAGSTWVRFPYPVPKLCSFARHWLPPLLWMCVIFSASGDQQSFQHSSRIVGPILHWLCPHLSDEAAYRVVIAVRKCAHLAEYAVLALLLWRALEAKTGNQAHAWQWSRASLVLLLVVLYAATDEIHQAFVPSREGCVRDVVVDTAGAALGLMGLWATTLLRRRIGRRP
jgi:VanZ family protein